MAAEPGDREARRQEAIDEFLGILRLDPHGDGWTGQAPAWHGPTLFGGVALALVITAGSRDAPPGSRLHAVHGHFLRPLHTERQIVFRNELVKQGRAFHVVRTTAVQDEKPAVVMTGSFTTDGDGYVYDLSGIPDGVPRPDEVPEEVEPDDEIGPWDARWLGPSPVRADGTREATHRHWFRLPRPLDDDPHLHAALFGYATDWTGIGGRPLDLEGDVTGMISLDHAAWFHRPARADEWHLQDVHSLVNAGGRGTLRGVIRNLDGEVVASMAQEMLLRPITA